MLKIECEIPSAEKATDSEILERFKNAKLILVLDADGNVSPLKLSKTKSAQKIPESEISTLHVESLSGLSCIGSIRYTGSNGELLIIGGDYVWIEY